ncbi:MAG: hypothetical protein RRY24_07485 [Clostridiales bacterium]
MMEFGKLIFILFWGGILGFFYQFITYGIKRHRKLTYLLWGLGGIFFFFATAIFLFYLNHGKVGLYGFPIMMLGFFLYLHFLCGRTSRALHPVASFLNKLYRCTKNIGAFTGGFIILPLGALVKLGEIIIAFLISPFKKLLSKKQKQRKEKNATIISEEF